MNTEIPARFADVGQFQPRSQEEYDAWLERERDRFNRENNVITSISQLREWEILLLERWKPGVVRFHARRASGSGFDFQMGYAKDEIFDVFQIL